MMNVSKILKEAGWKPDRKIDITEVLNILKQRGYTITESFIKFYQNFGNLYFDIQVDSIERVLNFDAKKIISYDYDNVIIEEYPKITKSKYLIPIGNINGTSYLAIDENSMIYSLYDGLVSLKGKGEEAVENLLTKSWREFEELPIPDWWGE